MPKYLLILHGAQDSSETGLEVFKQKLALHFESEPETVEEMLQELPVILEQGLELGQANDYLAMFESLGGAVEIVPASVESQGPALASQPALNTANVKSKNAAPATVSTSSLEVDLTQLSFEPAQQTKDDAKTPAKVAPPAATSVDLEFSLASDPGSPKQTNIVDKPSQTKSTDLGLAFEDIPELATTTSSQKSEATTSIAESSAIQLLKGEELSASINDLAETGASCASSAEEASDEKDTVPLPAVESPLLVIETNHRTAVKRKINHVTAVAGSLIAAVMIIAWVMMHFGGAEDVNEGGLSDPNMIANLLKEQNTILKPKPKEEAQAPIETIILVPDAKWSSEIRGENFIAELAILTGKDQLVEIEVIAKTPPARKLTPEEIVEGKKNIPWVEKLQVTGGRLGEGANKGLKYSSFDISFPTLVYVRDGYNGARTAATLRVAANYDVTNKIISGTWSLTSSNLQPEEATANIIKVSDSVYKVSYSGDFQASAGLR